MFLSKIQNFQNIFKMFLRFGFPHGFNIYVQFEGIVYQQIVGIPMGTNFAPLSGFVFIL